MRRQNFLYLVDWIIITEDAVSVKNFDTITKFKDLGRGVLSFNENKAMTGTPSGKALHNVSLNEAAVSASMS